MHTANLGLERRRGFRILVDIPLTLDFFSTDPMRLIPVELRVAYRSAPQPNQGNALQFSPPPAPIQPAKPLAIPDTLALRDRRDLRDFADDLKGHWWPLWLRVKTRASADACRITFG
jgi:hypothetical protein